MGIRRRETAVQGNARSTRIGWTRPMAALTARATTMAALVVAALSIGLLLRPLADEPIVLVLTVGSLGLPLAVALLAAARSSELRAVRREADHQIASMAHWAR
ncbi:MAG: hypothetical protein DWI58_09270 [Chloroflexi bacterium]|nr:MAG: hypothetical protein DWI58_09270 [Chloroflexota bacterium]